MIIDQPDVLLQITKKICEACSPTKEEIKEKNQRGYFDARDSSKYLSKYTVVDDYENDEITKKATNAKTKSKKYSYSLYLANKKIEKAWERAKQNKTRQYMKEMY